MELNSPSSQEVKCGYFSLCLSLLPPSDAGRGLLGVSRLKEQLGFTAWDEPALGRAAGALGRTCLDSRARRAQQEPRRCRTCSGRSSPEDRARARAALSRGTGNSSPTAANPP